MAQGWLDGPLGLGLVWGIFEPHLCLQPLEVGGRPSLVLLPQEVRFRHGSPTLSVLPLVAKPVPLCLRASRWGPVARIKVTPLILPGRVLACPWGLLLCCSFSPVPSSLEVMRVYTQALAALAVFVCMPSYSRVRAFLAPSCSRTHNNPSCCLRSSNMSPEPRAPRNRRTTTAAAATRPATTTMVFDPDVTPGALDAFHAWLTKSGVKLGDNAVLSGRSPLAGGRGLIATKPIENGQSVLAVPQSLGLTAAGLERSGIAKYVAGFEGWTGDTGSIALQILWEKAQGEESKIAPWIAVLPAVGELEMPLFWDEADLMLADASSTRVRVLKIWVSFSTRCCCFLPGSTRSV